MKLTAVLLFVASIHVAARTDGQTVTLKVKNAPMKEVFREIQKQTGLDVLVDEAILQKTGKVTLDVKDMPVPDVLNICLKNEPLSYSIVDGRIVIKPTTAVFQPAGTLPNEQTTNGPINIDVHGRILNENGEPVLATVTVKGTTKATSTNENGEFSLTGVDENATLVITGVSIETREIKINGKTDLAINVKTKVSGMQEVVVNKGYYTTSQKLNTGDVTKVSGADIQKQPVSNPLAALEGRVPGMFITQNTGMPGGSFKVQIRGRTSINNQIGNDPFYVIDGVPYTSLSLSNQIGAAGGSPLNFINPSDIESIDVLKDADATAIYGSRGANGVVLIVTKKNRVNKTTVDVNVYTGTGKVTRTMDWLNTPQYLQMRHEAFSNDGVTPTINNAPDLLVWDTTRYTNWEKLFIGGTAHYTDAQASISGGNSSTQYLIGGGYHKETTVFPEDFPDQKVSMHFNLSSLSNNEKFKIGLTGNYLADINNSVNHDFTSNIPLLAPDAPSLYKTDGTLNWSPNGVWGFDVNPFAYLLSKYKGRANNLISNSTLSYQILKGLQLKANLGYNYLQYNEIRTFPIAYNDPFSGSKTGSSQFINTNLQGWIIEPQMDYRRALGNGEFNALIGTSFQQNKTNGQFLTASGFTTDALLENIKAAPTVTVISTNISQYKYNAFFGRLSYNYAGKYLANLTARRDGSSRFGPGKQFSNFGSVGIGWIFSSENFITHNLPFLSYGKLRASYGTSGNDQIGDYKYLDLYNSTSYPYQGGLAFYPNNLFSPDYAWEVNKKFEGGLELGFFKDKISFDASYYINRSSNQLVGYTLPAITGFTSITQNLPATVQNTGLELSLNTTNIKNKKFNWSSSINLTIPKNKLVAYPNFSASPYASQFVIGKSLGIVKAYHFIGVNDTTGKYQFSDSKGNPTYFPSAPNDQTILIDNFPKLYGGIQNNIEYRGFQLSFFFQFVKQVGRLYLYNTLPGYFSTPGYNQPVNVLSRWQKLGDVTNIQRFSQTTSNAVGVYLGYRNANGSDLVYGDASFIRLKNLAISWIAPDKWTQKMHLKNIRIYLQGQNILTLTNYKGRDPENQNINALPALKVFTAGFQITL